MGFPTVSAYSNLWSYIYSNGPFIFVDYIAAMKPIPGVIVIGHYFAMFLHVMRIMKQTSFIPGSQLVDGPLFHLIVEIWFMIILFVMDVLQEAATNSQ